MNSRQKPQESKAPRYAQGAKTIIVLFFTGGGRIQAETIHTLEELDNLMGVSPDALVTLVNANDDPFIKTDHIKFYRKDVIFYNVVALNMEAIQRELDREASGLILPPDAGKIALQ